ncbi:MAG TPA: hypothetical protein VGV59_12250 [Pyrinomonadaceae bacterium]|nr:hypothetical protein [Pyrinomonadaceae bacterium]
MAKESKTSIERERLEQRRWDALRRTQHSALRDFSLMLENEFLAPEELAAQQSRLLSSLMTFAAERVPYYRELLRGLGLSTKRDWQTADLLHIPTLHKDTLRRRTADFRAEAFPVEELDGSIRSSGTTGQPVEVAQTRRSRHTLMLLLQRAQRWSRLNPLGSYAAIRIGKCFPDSDGSPLPRGVTARAEAWPLVGSYFKTGAYYGFCRANPLEHQIEWLRAVAPAYLCMDAPHLEHLALAMQESGRLESLRAVQSVCLPLTAGMRRRIVRVLGVPIHENYGLNELGIVASRCTHGRYHVHPEHCIVEVVGEDERPCAPGESGRAVVTCLTNFGMPLIRYETDDLVRVDDPCGCGLSLPTFGEVIGRYSAIKALPRGTLDGVTAFRKVLEELPAPFERLLRQYQIHQTKNDGFELRLSLAEPCTPALSLLLQREWSQTPHVGDLPLSIRLVDHIPNPFNTGDTGEPNGKFFHFTSDYCQGGPGGN